MKFWGGSDRFYSPDSFIIGNGGSQNWAKCFYGQGQEYKEYIQDSIRDRVEKCDSLAGFQMTFSCSGGTGSGLCSLLCEMLHDDYPDTLVLSTPVFPSNKSSHRVVSPYNTILCCSSLINLLGPSLCLCNDSLNDLCTNSLKLPSPTYSDLNHLISRSLSDITCSFRFGGQLNTSLRRLSTNLIPYPRLHMLITSIAPLTSSHTTKYRHFNIHSITRELLNPKNTMINSDPRHGRYLTQSLMYRGKQKIKTNTRNGGPIIVTTRPISSMKVDECALAPQNRGCSYYVEWVPWNIMTGMCGESGKSDEEKSDLRGSMVGNTTAIGQFFDSEVKRMEVMRKRKAWLWWYEREGMDEMEFVEAREIVLDMAHSYQEKQDACVEDSEEEWDEEEEEEESEDEDDI